MEKKSKGRKNFNKKKSLIQILCQKTFYISLENDKFFFMKKIKAILKFFGLKTPIYKIFYFFLKIFLKSKNTFINSIIFDIYSKKSKYILTENSYKEKFILITQDEVISKEIFVKGEFD